MRRGWNVGQLNHLFEERDDQVIEERWTAEIYGPRVDTRWHQVVGGRRLSTLQPHQGTAGTIESTTADGLVEMLRQTVEVLGLRDLKDPRPPKPEA